MTWLTALQEASARRELAALRDRLGQILPSTEPAIQAAIDQHAAAVRDILGLTAGKTGPVELAAYARGVRDAAADHGWTATPNSGSADWVTIRLLAAVSLGLPSIRHAYDLPTL